MTEKITYKEITDVATSEVTSIQRSDGWSIPLDESNSDYQRYLRWLENPDAEENGTIS